ncbi:YbaK/prolyl-tRNA synthetase associated region [Caenispirillum salinarum AK4]|uniref:YbaK/prolyl-tRNA synthetase associated region n=1 Tax=Caenispirillum salinarum AK4 TaxID=1238182 RepID=K9H390_9PROT|nr:YbaK/EbsC family protein [Caenispirillum salinarum]EKV32695.1 YbaK/prolyl-tRNA synthetase associated region [Caenispirillum salinarum AK4]
MSPAGTAGGASDSGIDSPAVRRVRAALADLGAPHEVVALSASARTAAEAAESLGVPLGAIVKSLVFLAGGEPVMALVAGDRRCVPEALPEVLGMAGPVEKADAEAVRAATGFTIGGVAPVAHATVLPIAIDASLGRFEAVYAAAGHPYCVFRTSLDELRRMTPGVVSEAISA